MRSAATRANAAARANGHETISPVRRRCGLCAACSGSLDAVDCPTQPILDGFLQGSLVLFPFDRFNSLASFIERNMVARDILAAHTTRHEVNQQTLAASMRPFRIAEV